MPTLVVRSVWRCGSRTGAFFARRPIVERKKRLFVCVCVCVCGWLSLNFFKKVRVRWKQTKSVQ